MAMSYKVYNKLFGGDLNLSNEIVEYSGRLSSLKTIWMGLKKGNVRFEKDRLKQTAACFPGMRISKKHLGSYSDVCDIAESETLSLLYPLSLIYPFNIRLISLKHVPLVMFKMLNTHTTITSYRKIFINETLDLKCSLGDCRVLEKGLEVDVKSSLSSAGSIAWECTNTFYFRGKFSDPVENRQKYYHERIESPDHSLQWKLPDKNGLRFARISGDSNPLHYNRFYSKLMGFERDFAQPFLVSEKVIDLLNKKAEDRPLRVDLFYKGQVYYGKMQTIKSVETGMATSFEIFCEGNDRPSIHGCIAELP